MPPESLIEQEDLKILVTDNKSVYDGTSPGSLQISQDEPLLWWMNKYDEYHGRSTPVPMHTEVRWRSNALEVGNLTVACHRTLRVPDQAGGPSNLPPVGAQNLRRV